MIFSSGTHSIMDNNRRTILSHTSLRNQHFRNRNSTARASAWWLLEAFLLAADSTCYCLHWPIALWGFVGVLLSSAQRLIRQRFTEAGKFRLDAMATYTFCGNEMLSLYLCKSCHSVLGEGMSLCGHNENLTVIAFLREFLSEILTISDIHYGVWCNAWSDQ